MALTEGGRSIERLRHRAKQSAKTVLARAGLELSRPEAEKPTMDGALRRRARRLKVGTVVDVGASDGSWSVMCSRHFPSAAYLLIEAQADPHVVALDELVASRSNFEYLIAAAGDHVGTARFDSSDPFGGAVTDDVAFGEELVVPMTTIDGELARRGLPPPYLLKLDTHGFEVPIFEGAQETLQQTSLVVVEVYNFRLQPTSLLFHEMCSYLGDRGLRCVDTADLMYRPGDGALWQLDMFFVPETSAEFKTTTYE